MGFPAGLVVKNISGLERSPGKGNDNPLQYSCLKKSHGQEEPGIVKSGMRLSTQAQRHWAFCWPVGILKQVYLCPRSPRLSSFCPSEFLPPQPYWITMLTKLQTCLASKPFLKLLPQFKMQNSAFKLGVPPGLPQTALSPVLFTWPAYPYLPQVSEPLLVNATGSPKTLGWMNETS